MTKDKRIIYLDHSATTPVDEQVAERMKVIMTKDYGNPSSIHQMGRKAKLELAEAREQIARMLNCLPEEVFFTSGGTEADNLAITGYANFHKLRGNHIITSGVEHSAVLESVAELVKNGFEVTIIPPDQYGIINPDAIIEAITPQTILISIMHANNEVGTINDIETIGKIAHSYKVAFHTDAVQSFGKIPIDVERMNVDLLSLSGHKIYGPKGIGALFVRNGINIKPLLWGGHQEQGIRSGTENLPGIVGLGVAAKICEKVMDSESEKLKHLRDMLHEMICDRLDNVFLNGHPQQRLPGSLNLRFWSVEGESLLMSLDLEGIAVSTGSACSSGNAKPSPVLLAMGQNEESAHSSIRFTLGRSNNEEEIKHTAEVVVKSVHKLRQMFFVD